MTKRKLWQKQWKLNEMLEEFETKDDLVLDGNLTHFDVLASIAHASMLNKIGILEKKEYRDIVDLLKEIAQMDEKGEFELEFGDEDIHTKIENYLVDKLGEAGKKIHTGRSRNDQVLTATRMFTKNQLQMIWHALLEITQSFADYSEKYEFVVMPGYTHMQKAMPTSIGMWAASFVESFFDDIRLLKNVYEINDKNPLGSAAGFGVPINLDREYTTELLGFRRMQVNSLYTQNSRGKVEGNIIAGLVSIMQTINKFATDVMMFTTDEFDYFKVDNSLCSGSSIMPQKRNVDVAELLRSKVHIILGEYTKMVSMSSNLISGYNRDMQDSKKVLFEALDMTYASIKIANLLINNLIPIEENLRKGITPDILATHKVIEMVNGGMAFRDAYDNVSSEIKNLKIEEINYYELLNQAKHLGATGNLNVDKILEKVAREKKELVAEEERLEKVVEKLMGM